MQKAMMQATRNIGAARVAAAQNSAGVTASTGTFYRTVPSVGRCWDGVSCSPVCIFSRMFSVAAGGSSDWKGRISGSGGDELLRSLNEEEIVRVGERTEAMWKDHVALTTKFPEASLPPGREGGSPWETAVSPDAIRRKRLVYRSKQRGWLEVDLLLGTWAEQNVPSLTREEMESYEDILNLETVDIFNFIAGNAKPPAFVDTPMMARLQSFVKSNPLGQGPANYASAKRLNNLT